MKKSLKVLSALAIGAVATASLASCGEKPTSEPETTTTVETTTGESSNPTSESTSETTAEQLSVSVDASKATTTFILGQEFSSTGIKVTTSTGVELEEGTGDNTYSVMTQAVKMGEVGEYTVTIVARVDGKTLTTTYKVSVVDAIWYDIASAEDFVNMRKTADENGYNDFSYRLTADIDLSNVVLEDSSVVFRGTFDGNGHSIKNGSYTTSASKQALLFNKLAGNAVIKNVQFFNCSAISSNETIAIIAGEVNDKESDVLVQNVEFSMCTVSTSNNYAAMIIARNETNAVKVTFDQITVKNFSTVSSTSYGGGLYSDIISGSSITVTNSDIDMDVTTGQNGSYITGRNRGADVDVENVIIRGNLLGGNNSTGFITGGGKESKNITIKNVVILGTTATTGDLLLGNSKGTTKTIENVYYVNAGTSATQTSATQISADTFTLAWAFDTLKLSSELFEADSAKTIKLKTSSSNVPGASETVKSISLATGNVKTEFFKNETFSTAGLAVSLVWTDGCVTGAASSDYTVKLLNANGQEVATDLSQLTAGTYTVEVTLGSVKASYDIDVVEYTETFVEIGDAKLVYTVGDKFDKDTMYVFAVKSNGTRVLLKSGYTLTVKDSDGVAVEDAFTKSGTYTVTVSANGFTKSFDLIVVAPQENAAYVQVNVSKTATDGQFVTPQGATDGYYTFTTIEKAVNYLSSLDLADEAVKVIYVADGTYKEKITVSVPNVTIVGQSKDKTILTYDMAEGSMKLNDSGTYGMDCATLIVTATAKGFSLSNITVRNDFDYVGSKLADKQAFALQCDADEATFNNVYFYGVQDTLYANDGRQYYYNCRIDGAVDYVFGQKNVVAVFDGCVFHSVTRYNADGVTPANNNGYIFAPKSNANGTTGLTYNYVVLNSTFEADANVVDGSMSVARPWGADGGVAVLNSTFSKAYATAGFDGTVKSRYADMSGNKPQNAHFFEYNNTGDGAISTAVTGVTMLTEEQAAAYTVENIFKATNGGVSFDGDWNPTGFYSKAEEVYVAYYEPTTKYAVGDTFTASTKSFYKVTFDSVAATSYKVEDLTSSTSEVFKSATAEVSTTEMLATAGTYTAELVYNNAAIATATVTVAEAGLQKYTTTVTGDSLAVKDPDLVAGTSEGKEYVFDGMTLSFYTKTSSGSRSNEKLNNGAPVTVDGTKYTYAVQLSGGKAAVSSTTLDNCAKIVLEHKSTITIICGAKSKGNESGKKPAIYNSSFTSVKEWSNDFPEFGNGEALVLTIELEAGTYYFGAFGGSGCYLYSITCEYEA